MALLTAEQPLEPDQRPEDDERAAIFEEIQTSLDSLAFGSQKLEIDRWLDITGDSFTPVKLATASWTLYSDPNQVRRDIVCGVDDVYCVIERGERGSYDVRMTGSEMDPDNPFVHLLALDSEELSPALDTFVLTLSTAIAQKKYGERLTISPKEFDTLFLSIEDEADERDVPVVYSFSGEYELDDGRKLVVMAQSDIAGTDGTHLLDRDKPYQMLSFQVKNDFRYDREVEFGEVSEKFYDDRQIESESPQEQTLRRAPQVPSVDQLKYISGLLAQAVEGLQSSAQIA